MIVLPQGGGSSEAAPEVVVYVAERGFLADLADEDALEFRIVDSEGVATSWADAWVKLGTGRYALEFELDDAAPVGEYRVEWRAAEQSGERRFVVVDGDEPIPDAYATVSEARSEGFPVSYSDARVAKALTEASREIDKLCRRRFGPYEFTTYRVDGRGTRMLTVGARDFSLIEEVRVDFVTTPSLYLEAYNGFHDQSVNRIVFRDPADILVTTLKFTAQNYLVPNTFARGRANVEVTALWGFVEEVPWGDPVGDVPVLIKSATLLLAARRIRRAWQVAVKPGEQVIGPISGQRTREQSVTYGKNSTNVPQYTGDPEVDRVIAMYRRNPMGFA